MKTKNREGKEEERKAYTRSDAVTKTLKKTLKQETIHVNSRTTKPRQQARVWEETQG
jgi:hypothetical protein